MVTRLPFKKKTTLFIVAIIIVAILVYIFLNYSSYQINSSLQNTRTLTYEQALADPVLSEVDQLIQFPEGESITVGEIKDKQTLEKYQQYFKKASIGQLLIVFPNMTIIYDPKSKTIIDIASVKLY